MKLISANSYQMIKRTLLKWKCKNLARTQPSEHVGYTHATRIGILYNAIEFSHRLISEFIKIMGRHGKDVTGLAFTDVESQKLSTFNRKDISIFGKLKKETMQDFVYQNFDFLIALDRSGDPHFKYMLALSKAHCKVGIDHHAYRNLLMMFVKPSNSPREELANVIKYLKMMTK